jgi:AraC-like DNA-binding protein
MANATGGSIRQFVGRNLASSDLLPDSLARRFRMSRAYLYRLFANDGGVQAYIRAQRLRRCFQAIADPTNHARGIGDIALSFGFVSEAHFSRVFRQEFGLNPTDARAQAAIPPPTG